MKPVLLCVSSTDPTPEYFLFDTTKEAMDMVARSENIKEAHIFTLYSSAEIQRITWNFATDTATNLRENSKVENGKRKGTWTDTEVKILEDNFNGGMALTEIAKSLHRTYNAVYIKAKAIGLV